jgi:hypothetical protein
VCERERVCVCVCVRVCERERERERESEMYTCICQMLKSLNSAEGFPWSCVETELISRIKLGLFAL